MLFNRFLFGGVSAGLALGLGAGARRGPGQGQAEGRRDDRRYGPTSNCRPATTWLPDRPAMPRRWTATACPAISTETILNQPVACPATSGRARSTRCDRLRRPDRPASGQEDILAYLTVINGVRRGQVARLGAREEKILAQLINIRVGDRVRRDRHFART